MPGKNDFANYRKMQEPFSTPAEANDALEKFYALVEAARNECRIMDVHVIAKLSLLDGELEGQAHSSAHFGNTLEGAGMCGWALGEEQGKLNIAVGAVLAGKKR